MEQLLSLLKTIPEYNGILAAIADGMPAAVTSIGQINRSHILAGLYHDTGRPMVLLCQDDMAARRLQEELKCFLGETAPMLPGRELTLYDAAVVSRAWEQKRLRQLYDLTQGKTRLQILSWEALSLRTKMVLQIHDELVFDAPEEEVETVVEIVRREMSSALDFGVPLEVSIGIGRNWLDAH